MTICCNIVKCTLFSSLKKSENKLQPYHWQKQLSVFGKAEVGEFWYCKQYFCLFFCAIWWQHESNSVKLPKMNYDYESPGSLSSWSRYILMLSLICWVSSCCVWLWWVQVIASQQCLRQLSATYRDNIWDDGKWGMARCQSCALADRWGR